MNIDETIAHLSELKETYGGGCPVFIRDADAGTFTPLTRHDSALVCNQGEIEAAGEECELEIIAVALHVQ